MPDIKDLQNFYETETAKAWAISTGNRYVTTLPTPTTGWLVVNPGNDSKREIVEYNGVGSDAGGNYVTVITRGVGGTTEQTHVKGEPCRLNLTAEHWSDMKTTINNIVAAGADDASVATKGISKLSTAPATASEPIAVGDNDPRVTLDAEGKFSPEYIPAQEIPVTLGETIDGTTTPKAVFIADGNTAETIHIEEESSPSGYESVHTTNKMGFTFNTGSLNRITETYWSEIDTGGIGVDDNLYIEIYAVDGSNFPTGSALASKVFNANTYNSGGAICVFDTPVTVSRNTNYALVARADTSDSGDVYEFSYTTTDPSVFETRLYRDSGGSWSDSFSQWATRCYIKGYETLEAGKVYLSGTENIQRLNIDGFVYESGVVDDVVSMQNDIGSGFTGLTLNDLYYLGTAGTISATESDRLVGKAISTTSIQITKGTFGATVETLIDVNGSDTLSYTFKLRGFVFGTVQATVSTVSSISATITVGGVSIVYSSGSTYDQNADFCVPVIAGDTIEIGNTSAIKKAYFRPLY